MTQAEPERHLDRHPPSEAHARLAGTPLGRQALRYMSLRARGLRGRGEDWTLAGLECSIGDEQGALAGGWLATDTALEVTPSPLRPWREQSHIRSVQISREVQQQLAELPMANVGPDLEPKFRVAKMKIKRDCLELTLSPGTWSEGRGFHVAVAQHPTRFAQGTNGWILPEPFGRDSLPGLAAAHVIVLTSDDQVLVSLRPPTASYAPSHWSVSFEEQLTGSDVEDLSRVFARAACRGLLEEFGVTVDPREPQLLSVVFEIPNLNLSAILLIRTRESLAEIRHRWLAEPRPRDAHEASEIRGIALSHDAIHELWRTPAEQFDPWHPTSSLRLAVLARWLAAKNAQAER